MKIKINDCLILEKELKKVIEEQGFNKLYAHYSVLSNEPSVKNVEARFVWDVFLAIPLEKRNPITLDLYKYLTDEHIETALKSILKNIVEKVKKHLPQSKNNDTL